MLKRKIFFTYGYKKEWKDDRVTWYRINHAVTQITQWDFQAKESRVGLVRIPLF